MTPFVQMSPPSWGRSPPRGSIAVIALMALAIASALSAGILRKAQLHRQALSRAAWKAQSEWLAESSLSRALAKLADDETYRSEEWTPAADRFAGAGSGRVSIAIGPLDETTNTRVITVIADFPDHPHDRVRTRRTLAVVPPDDGEIDRDATERR